MSTILCIFWVISFWGWAYCFLESIADKAKKDNYQKGMWICLAFMWIFTLLGRLV